MISHCVHNKHQGFVSMTLFIVDGWIPPKQCHQPLRRHLYIEPAPSEARKCCEISLTGEIRFPWKALIRQARTTCIANKGIIRCDAPNGFIISYIPQCCPGLKEEFSKEILNTFRWEIFLNICLHQLQFTLKHMHTVMVCSFYCSFIIW